MSLLVSSLSNHRRWVVGIAALALLAGGAPAAPETDSVRVLVQMRRAQRAPRMAGERAVRLRREFPEISAVAMEIPRARLAELRADPQVLAVEEDLWRRPLSVLGGAELKPLAKNGLYGLVTTKTTKAHARGIIGAGVVVCVADTGIDASHPDIAPAYRGGIDLVDDDSDPDVGADAELGGHGTHVAGTIVAALNGQGVRGVAFGAELFHARVIGTEGGRTSDIMAGVRHLVVERGCRVVNLSLGGERSAVIEENFYDEMRAVHGALVVAAAGNEGAAVSFPGAYPSVVAVAAVDAANKRAGFSNFGPEVDLAAPGVSVLSSVPRGAGGEARVQSGKKSFPAEGMTFANRTDGVAATLIDCGDGNSADKFPSKVAGNIALIKRGGDFFSVKVQNAMNAGALAVVIFNHEVGEFAGTLQTATTADGAEWIPAIAISDANGALLRRQSLGKRVTLVNSADDWALFSGTSMASPHVAGVAALVFAVKPFLGPDEVVAILKSSAIDLGSRGVDPFFGAGLVDADAATRAAAR
jgi:subtilisin family serine protease